VKGDGKKGRKITRKGSKAKPRELEKKRTPEGSRREKGRITKEENRFKKPKKQNSKRGERYEEGL